jgi:hypothetical protein
MPDGAPLFWDDTERLTLLALLLENVGVDRAVRLGDPEVWRGGRSGYEVVIPRRHAPAAWQDPPTARSG